MQKYSQVNQVIWFPTYPILYPKVYADLSRIFYAKGQMDYFIL